MRSLLLSLNLLLSGVAAAAGPDGSVTLAVPGMTCSVCPITVRQALLQVPGVLDAEVDYASRSARVQYDPARVDVARLRRATADAGYPSQPLETPAASGR